MNLHKAYSPFVIVDGQTCLPPNMHELRVGMHLQPSTVYTHEMRAEIDARLRAELLRERYQTKRTGVVELLVDCTDTDATVQDWRVLTELWPWAADNDVVAVASGYDIDLTVCNITVGRPKKVDRDWDIGEVIEAHTITCVDDLAQFSFQTREAAAALYKAMQELRQ